jgi:hypothetical protein
MGRRRRRKNERFVFIVNQIERVGWIVRQGSLYGKKH